MSETIQKTDILDLANGIFVSYPIEPEFMQFKVRVTGEGVDEALNGTRNDPRVRNYVGKELPINSTHVDPETGLRQRPNWLEIRFKAGKELSEEWDVQPIYDFLVAHLDPIDLPIPESHANWGKRQTYAFVKYQEQHVAQRFREHRLKATQAVMEKVSWAPAEEFLKLCEPEKYRWPTAADFIRIFADERISAPLEPKE